MTHTFYTGVGNRKAPREALDLCREVGRELALRGLTLRTGDAKGSDFAFLSGHVTGTDELDGHPIALLRNTAEVYRPSDDIPPWAFELAARVVTRKVWLSRPENWRRLFARSTMQVLGRTGNCPSRFLLCWSYREDPRMSDGTRVAVRVADDFEGCRSEQRPPAVDFADRIPWLNLKGLALADALAFAHQHAGVPVLRPGDVLSARLVPDGTLTGGNGVAFLYLADEWHVIRENEIWRGPGHVLRGPLIGNFTINALGLTQETATADNLRRLAQEYEERKAQ